MNESACPHKTETPGANRLYCPHDQNIYPLASPPQYGCGPAWLFSPITVQSDDSPHGLWGPIAWAFPSLAQVRDRFRQPSWHVAARAANKVLLSEGDTPGLSPTHCLARLSVPTATLVGLSLVIGS